jgi:hypothetical protein
MATLSELQSAIHLTLSKYFKSEKRLAEATDDLLKTVAPYMNPAQAPAAKSKGATVMTEAASFNRGARPEQI